MTILLTILGIIIVFTVAKPLRLALISKPLMELMKKALPRMSDTERVALEAGDVWWDAELFSGKPKWKKLLDFKSKKLTKAEKEFMEGPVEELCKMLDDEKIAQDRAIPDDVWQFIKEKKFLGMIIPKKYGGLGFGARGHSEVITRIASVSNSTGVVVMVPNSLGPGELLHNYGTKAQKEYYLPRLATGEDIPCFALTEPHAGSDAASGRSLGVVCKGMYKGKEVLGIKLTFNKRYITLAPIATVVGLAFHLKDPEHLLGKGEEIGITCALLPRSTKGLNIGRRHDPMGVPFPNGPVSGDDVFIPMDYVIGGEDYVGQGWRMLMECLAAGRGISLPSLSVGAAELATRTSTMYALVREQFGLNIGRFEGVRERLARMAGHAYFMNSMRELTCGVIDNGGNPAVMSAISKYYLTEGMRLAINDGMDVQAGAAICTGPRNIFARPYTSIPIGITVEGANILTRSLIIFGQGAMRCHPYVLREVQAIQSGDVEGFDSAFFGHVKHVISNKLRAFLMGIFGGCACVPVKDGTKKYYGQLTRLSAAFAYVADIGLATLGGSLKVKEHLSGRYADALGWMMLASTTLKRYHDAPKGKQKQQRALLDYVMAMALYNVEEALVGVLDNLPNRFIAKAVKFTVFPLGRKHTGLQDKHIEAVADIILNDDDVLKDITSEIYIPEDGAPGLGMLEQAYHLARDVGSVRTKIKNAVRKGIIAKGHLPDMVASAKKEKVITAKEYAALLEAMAVCDDAIQVDSFTPAAYKKRR